MSEPKKDLFIPDLSHLHDAFFETEDEDEGTLLQAIIQQLEARESWPLDFYKNGFAAEHFKPYALNALGRVVQHYDDEMESRALQAEYNRRYPVPDVMPPRLTPKPPNKLADVDFDVVPVKVEPEQTQLVDLVSDSISGDKKIEGEEEVVGKKFCKRIGGRKSKGKKKWVPFVIVCGLAMPDGVTVKSRKGKEKMVEGNEMRKKQRKSERIDRLNLGGSEKRISAGMPKYLQEPKIGQEYADEYKMHDIFVEDDAEGWRWFKVVEEYDSGLDEGPDIPMSPPSCDELDPNEHIFLLLKKGPTS